MTQVGYIAILRRKLLFFYSGSLLRLKGYALKHIVSEDQQNINPASIRFSCFGIPQDTSSEE